MMKLCLFSDLFPIFVLNQISVRVLIVVGRNVDELVQIPICSLGRCIKPELDASKRLILFPFQQRSEVIGINKAFSTSNANHCKFSISKVQIHVHDPLTLMLILVDRFSCSRIEDLYSFSGESPDNVLCVVRNRKRFARSCSLINAHLLAFFIPSNDSLVIAAGEEHVPIPVKFDLSNRP